MGIKIMHPSRKEIVMPTDEALGMSDLLSYAGACIHI